MAGLAARPRPDPRIFGLVSRGGTPQADREVCALGVGSNGAVVVAVAHTDTFGQYHLDVPAGNYRVRVARAGLLQSVPLPGRRLGGEAGPDTAPVIREVRVTDRPVACDLALPVGTIWLRTVRQGTREPVADVEIRLTDGRGLDLTGHTDHHGELLAGDLPPGAWSVRAARRGYRAGPARTVELGEWRPGSAEEFVLEPACVLDLVVADESGARVADAGELGLEVVHEESGAVVQPRRWQQFHGTQVPRELQFDDLREGSYRVQAPDQWFRDGVIPAVRYHAVELVAPLTVTVVPGELSVARVQVRRRCRAVLHAVSRDHDYASSSLRMERVDADLGVAVVLPVELGPGDRVRPPAFLGPLVPGLYQLTFTGPAGQVHRETLHVGSRPISRRFQLPW